MLPFPFGDALCIARDANDGRAELHQLLGDGQADAARRAGHKRGFSGETPAMIGQGWSVSLPN